MKPINKYFDEAFKLIRENPGWCMSSSTTTKKDKIFFQNGILKFLHINDDNSYEIKPTLAIPDECLIACDWQVDIL